MSQQEALRAALFERIRGDAGERFHLDDLELKLLPQFPELKWELWALFCAGEDGLVSEFTRLPEGPVEPSLARAMVRLLMTRFAMRFSMACWAIETWGEAYGRPVGEAFTDSQWEQGAAVPLVEPVSPSLPNPQPVVGESDEMGLPMVPISAGRFSMGSPLDEEDRGSTRSRSLRAEDELLHEVELTRNFLLGASPVTQDVWEKVMGEGNNPSNLRDGTRPVEQVSFFDAVSFCNAASMMAGLSPVYEVDGDEVRWLHGDRDGYRLPTEAEWEYACRAGTTTSFGFGDTLGTEEANYDGRFPLGAQSLGQTYNRTSPPGCFPPNAWGLYDMHGNVWEWCWDWYGPYSKEGTRDSRGPETGERRVARGGSWLVFRSLYCRSAFRNYVHPHDFGFDVGFRVARFVTGE
jgi:formylglycine-generating enzyme required for sulfatase activity